MRVQRKLGKKPGSAASKTRTIQRASLPAQVQEMLREEIVTGVWEPGVRLPEIALCERFGVSRTPLREALKALETEGLLNLYPSRGAIVADVTIKDIEDKMRVLRVLEGLAVEIACEVATNEEIEAISRIQEGLQETYQRSRRLDNARDFYSGNFGFHQALVEASHNDTLIEMHHHLHRHVQRVRHFVGLIDDGSQGMAAHEQIVAALRERNANAAKTAMSNHMRTVEDRLISRLKKERSSNNGTDGLAARKGSRR